MANRAPLLNDLEFLDNACVKIQNMGFKTSKMGQLLFNTDIIAFSDVSGSIEEDKDDGFIIPR